MKAHRLLSLVGLAAGFLAPVPTRAQQWQWAQNAGGIRSDQGWDVAADAAGNSYVTGSFRGTATFGSFILTSAEGDDIFVAKYGPTGDVLWASHLGGGLYDSGTGIAVDSGGYVYVTGWTFERAFVAKYDPEGDLLWTRISGGTESFAGGFGIAADASGNAYVTGYFGNHVTFGRFTLVSAGITDVFVVTYDPNGEVRWARRAGGFAGASGDEAGWSIALDSAGNAYATGVFAGVADFGPFTLTGAGYDLFVAKYGPTGDVLWARRAGGAGVDMARDIAVDTGGNAFITGFFLKSADFGPFALTGAGFDVFVAKYGPSGDALWARRAGGESSFFDGGNGITVDAAGDAYVTGGFQGSATFGGGHGDGRAFVLTTTDTQNVFVAKYGTTGDVLWARRTGGSSGAGIAVDATGGVYVTGSFGDSADFGPFTLTSAGESDAFLARLHGSVTGSEDGPAGSDALILAAFAPHPVDTRATAMLTARDAQHVRVVLHDALGRELALLFDGTLAAGAQHPVDVDVSTLLPGVYVLRVAGERTSVARRLVVAR